MIPDQPRVDRQGLAARRLAQICPVCERSIDDAGYGSGRLLVIRETLGQAPPQFSAATKTFCTELEQRIAGFGAQVLGPEALPAEPFLRLLTDYGSPWACEERTPAG